MKKTRWLGILAGGVAWAGVYNAVWGIAWFGFMRREWTDATVSVGRSFPWTPQFWAVWLPMTLPIGIAIMAYVADREQQMARTKRALAATLVLWVTGTVGMAIFAWQESVSQRVILLDSIVNLLAIALASIIGAWSLRVWRRDRSPLDERPNTTFHGI